MNVTLYANVPLDRAHQRFFATSTLDVDRNTFLHDYIVEELKSLSRFWKNGDNYVDLVGNEQSFIGVNYMKVEDNFDYFLFVTDRARQDNNVIRLYVEVDDFQTYLMQAPGRRGAVSGTLLMSNTTLFDNDSIDKHLIISPAGVRFETQEREPLTYDKITAGWFKSDLSEVLEINPSQYPQVEAYVILIAATSQDRPSVYIVDDTFNSPDYAIRYLNWISEELLRMLSPLKPLHGYVVPKLFAYSFPHNGSPITVNVGPNLEQYELYETVGSTIIEGDFGDLSPEYAHYIGTFGNRITLEYGLNPSFFRISTSTEIAQLKITLEAGNQMIDLTDDFTIPVSYSAASEYYANRGISTFTKTLASVLALVGGAASGNAVIAAGGAATLAGEAATAIDLARQPAIVVGNTTPCFNLRHFGSISLWSNEARNSEDILATIAEQGYKYPLTWLDLDFSTALQYGEAGTRYYKFADVKEITGSMPQDARESVRNMFMIGIYITYE